MDHWKMPAAALLIGTGTGILASLFLILLDTAIAAGEGLAPYGLLLPAVLVTARIITRNRQDSTAGQETGIFLQAINSAAEGSVRNTAARLAAAVLTIASGGSAGRAGPCAQIGALLSRNMGDLLSADASQRQWLRLCGVSAGFAAVFGAPLAGTVLAYEILRPKPDSISSASIGALLSAAAAWIAAAIARLLPVSHHHREIHLDLDWSMLPLAVGAGLLFALTALLLIWALNRIERLIAAVRIHPLVKAAAGGLMLLVFSLAGGADCLGLGGPMIDRFLAGEAASPVGFIGKTLTTSITLGAGGSGGIFSPIFFIGASAGNALGGLLGADRGLFAALGLLSVLSASVNAPLAAIVLAWELFGPAVVPATAVSAGISYAVTRHRRFPTSLLLFSRGEH